jgi:hypothetical protein
VRHYRGEFNRKIKKEGYPALLTAMRKKLTEIKADQVKVDTTVGTDGSPNALWAI